MNILEQEIEQIIYSAIENNQTELLRERGLPIYNRYDYVRQPELGNYGRADLIGFRTYLKEDDFVNTRRKIDVQVFEFKKDEVNINTYLQAVRYAKAIEQIFDYEDIYAYCDFTFHLIGKSIDTKTPFCYLPDVFDNVSLYTYTIDLAKGIVFKKRTGFSLEEDGFTTNKKPFTNLLIDNLKRNYKEGYVIPADNGFPF